MERTLLNEYLPPKHTAQKAVSLLGADGIVQGISGNLLLESDTDPSLRPRRQVHVCAFTLAPICCNCFWLSICL